MVANRDVVNNCFSAPLLGRFEKHFLAKSNYLNVEQIFVAERLKAWVYEFAAKVFPKEKRLVQLITIYTILSFKTFRDLVKLPY